MTEEKSNLSSFPQGWALATIGDICEKIHYGYTAKSSEKPLGPKMLRITDIQNRAVNWDSVPYCQIDEKKKPDYILKEGDLVFARTGATVGKSFLIKGIIPEAVFASYLIRVTFPSQIKREYVYYFFQSLSYWLQIYEGQIGIGQPNVNSTKLSKLSIPIAPLPEQDRIVSKLEELFTRLDAGVKSLQNCKAQLQLYRQAVLKHALTGKLTEGWRKTHEFSIESTLVKDSHQDIIEQRKKTGKRTYENLFPINYDELPVIPANWIWVRFEEVIYVIDYRGRTPPFSLDGIPHLRSNNIKDGKIVWENLKYISENDFQKYMVRGLPRESDILFTTEAPLGEIAFVPDKKFSIAQRVIILRPNNEILNPEFLFYQLMSEMSKGRLLRKGTGTTVTGVSYRNLRQVELAIPPLEEQKIIVNDIKSLLSVFDEIEKAINQNLIHSEQLYQSILKTAFEGRLIAQDPADEPAEKLLERIKKEKETNQRKRNSRRKYSKRKQRRLNSYVE